MADQHESGIEQSPSLWMGIDAFRHDECSTTWYAEVAPQFCPGCGEEVRTKFTVVGDRNALSVDTDNPQESKRG